MKYTITMKRESKQTCRVLVNGLCVAVGPEKMCKALVRELRTFKERAKLVYDLEKIGFIDIEMRTLTNNLKNNLVLDKR